MGEASRRSGPGTPQERFERRRDLAVKEGRIKDPSKKAFQTGRTTVPTTPPVLGSTPTKSSLRWGGESGIYRPLDIPMSPSQGIADATTSRSGDSSKTPESLPDTQPA